MDAPFDNKYFLAAQDFHVRNQDWAEDYGELYKRVGGLLKRELKHWATKEKMKQTMKRIAAGEQVGVAEAEFIAVCREIKALRPTGWSKAKPPSEWCRELGVSSTTLRRRVKKKQLIVDIITSKSWRIRLDSLERFVDK